MTKRRLPVALFVALIFVLVCVLGACRGGNNLHFEKREYDVKNGDSVTVQKGKADYKLLGKVPSGVSVDGNGKFSIDSSVALGTQVVLAALVKDKVVDTAICKIQVSVEEPTLEIVNGSSYLVDGEQVRVTCTPAYSVQFGIKESVEGVVIDEVSGRVSYRGNVADATPFTVVATAMGAIAEREFLAATANFVTADTEEFFSELGKGTELNITLNYGADIKAKEQGVLGVELGGTEVDENDFSYNAETCTLTISASAVAHLGSGTSKLYISTAKNTIAVTINVANFIRTAEDLAAIGQSAEGLNGYHILVNDIDLTEYLSSQKDGWFPIGTYFESDDGSVIDTTQTFGGHFDGNGHTISGLWIARQSYTFVEGFNCGLFGYVNSSGIVENVTLKSAPGRENATNSYSGGLVGHNCGIVRNCLVDVNVFLISEHRAGGGICGMNEGTISNCISLGYVTVGKDIGAICGWNKGEITDCYAVDDPENVYRKSFESEEVDGVTGEVKKVNPLVYPGRPELISATGLEEGKTTNCTVFANLNQLLEQADFSAWSNWSANDGALPSVKTKAIG